MRLCYKFQTIRFFLVGLMMFQNLAIGEEKPFYMCNSTIYCRGPILEAVNRVGLFTDSKDFVDSPMIKSPEETLAAFNETFPDANNITKKALDVWFNKYFLPPGRELIENVPSDYQEKPRKFNAIQDPYYKKWAYSLNDIWKTLSREVNKTVKQHPERFTILYVPYPFMVPGGRFREFYNWDTYWIEIGLLSSGMYNTSKNMIRNFAYLVENYGLIPNGARSYYLERSHPPFFIPMVNRYYQATQDDDLVREILPSLEKELQFWMSNRSVELSWGGKTILVYRYTTRTNVPRPESYAADVDTAINTSASDKPFVWRNLAAGAESGWDFTSRFLADRYKLNSVNTNRMLPTDLNAFICANFRILSELFANNNNTEKAAKYRKYYNEMVDIMMTLFYNKTEGVWFDYNLDTQQHNLNFYISNIIPLYAGCYKFDESTKNESFLKIANYLKNSGALNYKYGVPASLLMTGEQWDFPNGWPPLNHMIIEGFDSTNHPVLQDMAFKIADEWIRNGYLTFQNHSSMYEKYNVQVPETAGTGGEYLVQVGFGWTNGVALDLLVKYGDRLSFNSTDGPISSANLVKISRPTCWIMLIFVLLMSLARFF